MFIFAGISRSKDYWERRLAEKSAEPDINGCIFWTGTRNQKGYGRIGLKHNGRSFYVGAHRLSWALANDKDTAKLFVCHSCDNPSCVAPDHLFLGNALINNLDAFEKGRNLPIGKRRLKTFITLGADTKSLAEWCREGGLSYSVAYWRLANGWDTAAALRPAEPA